MKNGPHRKLKVAPIANDTPLARLDFELSVDYGSEEPDRFLMCYRGRIIGWNKSTDSPDTDAPLGEIIAFVLQRGRIMNEGGDAFETMDSVSGATCECYEALFDVDTSDWKEEILTLNEDALIMSSDLLFIDRIELGAKYRGMGIGAQVVKTTVAALGSGCGLVACKPFPLQYQGYLERRGAQPQLASFEKQRRADFRKVARFWAGLGFCKLKGSEFYVACVEDLLSNSVRQGGASGRSRRRRCTT